VVGRRGCRLATRVGGANGRSATVEGVAPAETPKASEVAVGADELGPELDTDTAAGERSAVAANGRMRSMLVSGSGQAHGGTRQVVLLSGLLVTALGWMGLAIMAASMLSASPPRAGFDLVLVLEAGERVAAGRSPYDPALLAGANPPASVDLFFAYPPVVGQAAALLAGTPLPMALAGLWSLAVAGLVWGIHRLAAAAAVGDPGLVAVLALAVLPFVSPFAVALLFGNLDALFPAVFAVLLWWAEAGSRRAILFAGVGLGLASVTKLGPLIVFVWLAIRALRSKGGRDSTQAGAVLVTGLATIAGCLAVSLLGFGIGPWQEYLAASRVVAGAELVEPRNIGPAAQVALWLGGGEADARLLHVFVFGVAVAATALAAWRVAHAGAGLFVAAVASLVVLPITWFHYPAVLLPFALGRMMRVAEGGVGAWWWGPAAGVVAAVAVAWPPLLWLAVALVALGYRTRLRTGVA
jgi:hypothetical protein